MSKPALSWANDGIDTLEKAEKATFVFNESYNSVKKAFGLDRLLDMRKNSISIHGLKIITYLLISLLKHVIVLFLLFRSQTLNTLIRLLKDGIKTLLQA